MKLTETLAAAFVFFLAGAAGPAAAEAPACGGLQLPECWSRSGCVVECANEDRAHCAPYRCREAKNSCEKAAAGSELTKEKCQQFPGCVFDPAFCFCPGPMECFCGGGKPSSCRKE